MYYALIALGIVLLVLFAFAMWAMGVYNSLVKLRNRFENAFSQIDDTEFGQCCERVHGP